MENEKHYRHEWKHIISPADLLTIRQRMRAVAKPDPHAKDGRYLIRSLYFDDMHDRALREKCDGVNMREKFRIRCYNLDPSMIFLEKKSKVNGLGTKYKAPLTQDEVSDIIRGDTDFMMEREDPLIRELYCKMKNRGLRPKTIVDYTREPFIFAPGNVRVTLDYDIRTGLLETDMLDKSCVTVSAGEASIILEVKWDAYLPDIIRDAVQLTNCRSTAFPKYAQCRVYG